MSPAQFDELWRTHLTLLEEGVWECDHRSFRHVTDWLTARGLAVEPNLDELRFRQARCDCSLEFQGRRAWPDDLALPALSSHEFHAPMDDPYAIREEILRHYGGADVRCSCPCGCGTKNLTKLLLEYEDPSEGHHFAPSGLHWFQRLKAGNFPDGLVLRCASCKVSAERVGECADCPGAGQHEQIWLSPLANWRLWDGGAAGIQVQRYVDGQWVAADALPEAVQEAWGREQEARDREQEEDG